MQSGDPVTPRMIRILNPCNLERVMGKAGLGYIVVLSRGPLK